MPWQYSRSRPRQTDILTKRPVQRQGIRRRGNQSNLFGVSLRRSVPLQCNNSISNVQGRPDCIVYFKKHPAEPVFLIPGLKMPQYLLLSAKTTEQVLYRSAESYLHMSL